MIVTPSKLTRAAGLAAVVAGLLFIIIQPIHPSEDLAAVTGNGWAITGYMTMAFAISALIGVSGIYLRHVEKTGLLGLIGYLMLGAMFLLTTAFVFAETLVLPLLAEPAPQFVEGFLGIFSGSPSEVDLKALGAVGGVSFVLYLVGGALLGSALIRARVLARWASGMLVFASLGTLLVPVLPHAVARYAAVPMGVALLGLGHSLWSEKREIDTVPVPAARSAPLDLAAAE